jgi:hypothetical protein
MKTLLTATLTTALLAGCAAVLGPDLRTGQNEAEVMAALGVPTARHALPGGRTRLEYATGPYGRQTWMVDIDDATRRVVRHAQVLNEAHFADFQQRAPGMTRQQVLQELGRPGERGVVGLQPVELWSWRYPTYDCLWFQVQFRADGRVDSAGYNTDWMCDRQRDRRE